MHVYLETLCYIIVLFLYLFVEIYHKIDFCANSMLNYTNDRQRKKRLYTSPFFPIKNRGDKIRTCDPLVPNQVLYQTEPHLGVPSVEERNLVILP